MGKRNKIIYVRWEFLLIGNVEIIFNGLVKENKVIEGYIIWDYYGNFIKLRGRKIG